MIYTQAALLFILLATSAAYEKEDGVFVLKTSDYDQWVSEYSSYLRVSEFYAPWCGHCKSLAPEYSSAALKLADQNAKIVLAKIDATVEEQLAQRFGVQGFPTLKMYLPNSDKLQDYGGPRTAEGIITYLEGQMNKNLKLQTLEDLENLRKKHQDLPLIVGVFGEEQTTLQEHYNQLVAEKDQVFRFAHFQGKLSDEIQKYFEITGEGIAVFRTLLIATPDEKVYQVKSEFQNKEDLSSWLDTTLSNLFVIPYPPVQEFLKEKNIPFGLLITKADFRKAAKQVKYYYNRLRKISDQTDNFIIGVIDNYIMSPFLNAVAKEPTEDAFVIQFGDENYLMEGNPVEKGKLNTNAILEFVNKFKKGEADQYIKSSPIPEEEYENDVKILVAKNAKSVLADTTKDIFILFYAPWCGHCKSLKPTYEQLGAKYRDSQVLISKFDATENDLPPGYELEGYPTLYFLPANSKKPFKYDGERDIDDLVEFVEQSRETKEKKEEI